MPGVNQQEMDAVRNAVQTAQRTADEALEKANAAGNAARGAKTTADAAQEKATANEAAIAQVRQTANTALETANAARREAGEAKTAASRRSAAVWRMERLGRKSLSGLSGSERQRRGRPGGGKRGGGHDTDHGNVRACFQCGAARLYNGAGVYHDSQHSQQEPRCGGGQPWQISVRCGREEGGQLSLRR